MIESIYDIQFAKCEIELSKWSMQIVICRDDGGESRRLNHLKAICPQEVQEFKFPKRNRYAEYILRI